MHAPRHDAALRRLAPAAGLGLAVLLGGCAAPGAGLPWLPEAARGDGGGYRLGPSDEVRVTVFNDPRLTGEFRVTDAGAIALPLVGTVPASGRSTREVERAIEREMQRKGLFRDPSVAVEVRTYRPIYVLGMVERGGRYQYEPGMTALAAVAVAGGFNYRALQDYVSVTRIGPDGVAREHRAPRDALLLPGDVVTVFERRF